MNNLQYTKKRGFVQLKKRFRLPLSILPHIPQAKPKKQVALLIQTTRQCTYK